MTHFKLPVIKNHQKIQAIKFGFYNALQSQLFNETCVTLSSIAKC